MATGRGGDGEDEHAGERVHPRPHPDAGKRGWGSQPLGIPSMKPASWGVVVAFMLTMLAVQAGADDGASSRLKGRPGRGFTYGLPYLQRSRSAGDGDRVRSSGTQEAQYCHASIEVWDVRQVEFCGDMGDMLLRGAHSPSGGLRWGVRQSLGHRGQHVALVGGEPRQIVSPRMPLG